MTTEVFCNLQVPNAGFSVSPFCQNRVSCILIYFHFTILYLILTFIERTLIVIGQKSKYLPRLRKYY